MWPSADYRYEPPRWPGLWRDGGPTGLLVGAVHVALGVLASLLTLLWIPNLFGIEFDWVSLLLGASLFGPSCPQTQSAASDYLSSFFVVGGASWLAVAAAVAVLMTACDPPRRRSSLVVSAGWFVVLVVASLITAAVIGPLSPHRLQLKRTCSRPAPAR